MGINQINKKRMTQNQSENLKRKRNLENDNQLLQDIDIVDKHSRVWISDDHNIICNCKRDDYHKEKIDVESQNRMTQNQSENLKRKRN